ncbi:hypothetical protein HBB16_09440 [Pseudonocardia sp. MCCB 268]|nr:hypothetical protein [Pseudonocardia cytotoxica]
MRALRAVGGRRGLPAPGLAAGQLPGSRTSPRTSTTRSCPCYRARAGYPSRSSARKAASAGPHWIGWTSPRSATRAGLV